MYCLDSMAMCFMVKLKTNLDLGGQSLNLNLKEKE